MIAIVDYGMGNLRSVEKALQKVGEEALVTNDAGKIRNSKGVVLPGVGAFRDCMRNLRQYGLIEPLYKFIQAGRPFLGICLGLQLLFTHSEEFGRYEGLGVIKGRVVRFPNLPRLKVPHMGWNTISIKGKVPLLKGIEDGSYFYFVHSYYVIPEDEDIIATTTHYGVEFVSSINKDNIFACQFHPEKSQKLGLRILKGFGDLVRENAG
jgi:glutamine amidotransferase